MGFFITFFESLEFFGVLIQKSGVLASSPQSTLSGLGSWSTSSNGSPNGPSQVPSPPTTPFGAQNDTWDLIYAAAGQVARLKMSNEAPKYTSFNYGRGLPKAQSHAVMRNSSSGLYPSQGLSYNLAQTNQVSFFFFSEVSTLLNLFFGLFLL